MDIMAELNSIDKFFEELTSEEFNNMLIRNGHGNEIYKRSDDIDMGIDLEGIIENDK